MKTFKGSEQVVNAVKLISLHPPGRSNGIFIQPRLEKFKSQHKRGSS